VLLPIAPYQRDIAQNIDGFDKFRF